MNLDQIIYKFSSRYSVSMEPNRKHTSQIDIGGSRGSQSSQDFLVFVRKCCVHVNVTAEMVMNHLLSDDDYDDFSEGLLTEDGLMCAIRYWESIGAPYNY